MAMDTWLLVLVLLILVCAIGLCVVLFLQIRHLRTALPSSQAHPSHAAAVTPGPTFPSPPQIAFVANPSKVGVAALKPALLTRCTAEGLPTPIWLETTVADPGTGQARQAIAQGADLVVAVGGDGTVRAVAAALVGTSTPMGILPLGTGNLLARNLDIPINDREEAFELLLDGVDRPIDVGWLQVTEPDTSEVERLAKIAKTGKSPGTRKRAEHKLSLSENAPANTDKHLFLVISGVGFDAAMIAEADSSLKEKVGWIAYFLAAARHLHGPRMTVRITLDDDRIFATQLRSLMVGNCGRLPGGLTLIPDAVIDDGIHDVAAIDTRGGMAGWVQLFGEVVMQGYGMTNDLPTKVGRIDHTQAKTTIIAIADGAQAQVDGDVLGRATKIKTWVDPLALVVRAPIPRLDIK